MRVLYRDDEELILKEVMSLTVKGGYVVIESTTGDKRTLLKAHDSWSDADLEALIRRHAANPFIDIEPVTQAR